VARPEQRWHIFNSGLLNERGHYFNEALTLSRELRRRGSAAVIYGHKQWRPTGTELAVLPVLRNRPYDALSDDALCGELLDFLGLNQNFREDLDTLDRGSFDRDDIAIFLTVTQNQLMAITRWAESFSESEPFRIVTVLHHPVRWEFSSGRISHPESYYRYIWRMLPPAVKQRIFICTTTDALADQYASVIGTRPKPLPMMLDNVPLAAPTPRAHAGERPIVVAYLGHARPEKGYHLLPDLIAGCAAAPRLQFFVQAAHGQASRLQRVDAALKANPRVRLVEGELDAERYYRALAEADLILIPNHPARYRERLSGIYAEAALAGKPVVAPAGTWTGAQVARWGNGVLFGEYSARGIAAAVLQAVAQLDRLQEQALKAAQELRREHGAEAFVDQVLALAHSDTY
jgi:glycosyltransferase involved in cell wall biosynthesis